MAPYRRVYDSRHLQADCQEPGSAPEPYVRQSSTGYLYVFFIPFSKLSEWRSAVSSTAHVASILHLALLIISNARRRSTDQLETQPTRTDRRGQRTFQPCCPTPEKHIGVGFATGRDAAECGVYDRSKRLATGKHRSTRPAHVPAPLSETQATRRSSLSARNASYPHRSGS